MKKHLQYLKYVLRHKWFVFYAGLKIGAPIWRLIIHDWSKFLPSEWSPYVEWFYGDHGAGYMPSGWGQDDIEHDANLAGFNRAWLFHQRRNKHHWQYWVLRRDDGGLKCLPMPRKYALEMVADWLGAGRAQTGKWYVYDWYQDNRNVIKLHPETRKVVEEAIMLPESPANDVA